MPFWLIQFNSHSFNQKRNYFKFNPIFNLLNQNFSHNQIWFTASRIQTCIYNSFYYTPFYQWNKLIKCVFFASTFVFIKFCCFQRLENRLQNILLFHIDHKNLIKSKLFAEINFFFYFCCVPWASGPINSIIPCH